MYRPIHLFYFIDKLISLMCLLSFLNEMKSISV